MADSNDSEVGTQIGNPVVKRMLKFWKLSESAESENRTRGLTAQKFRKGGDDQWDSELLKIRRADNRPCESYNQIPQFVHQVTNDMRMNMPQIKYIPGNDGSKEVAEVREDLVRNIQSTGEGEVACDAAADSQVTIGWGYWRYITEYENDNTFDQIIKPLWIPNPFKIYDDPYATMQDFSDRKGLVEVEDVDVDWFREEYKQDADGDNIDYDSSQLQSIGDATPSWANEKTVRIAEFWEVTKKRAKLYRDKITGAIGKDKPKGTLGTEYDERDVEIPKVMWYKCTAAHKLEEREWPGKYIPYIRASGETLVIDGKTYYMGLVEPMMPCQRQYNYWTNGATEMVALAPKAPYIAAIGQLAGLERFWDNANTKNYPYLPYRPTDYKGQLVGPPQRQSNAMDISSALTLVQQSQQNFYTTSGIYPASLGKQGNETSGKAINARQREGDVSTFHFPDNFARALRFAGRVLDDLIPKIYDGARTLRLLKEDKTHREVKVNQPFQDDDGTEKILDLTVGVYDVVVTTGPSYSTKRQESADMMMKLATQTNLMEVAPDIFYRTQDFPGADKLADRYEKTLPPGLADDPNMKNIPPQIQAELAQAGKMIQILNQQLEQAKQQLQDKQAEDQAKLTEAQAKIITANSQAQQDAAETEFERMKLEMENQQNIAENQLREQELNLEWAKLDFTNMQKANAQPAPIAAPAEKAPASRNELLAQVDDMDQSAAQEQEQQDTENQLKLAEIEQQHTSSQMLMDNLNTIHSSIADLTAAIKAPKTLVRNPKTNMVEAVVTTGA